MSNRLVADFAVQQVVEKPGANGYETLAVGYFQAPEPRSPEDDPQPEFFPDLGISARLELDWHRFAGPKPAAAFFGAVYRVTIEAVSVPTEVVRDTRTAEVVDQRWVDRDNGGLKAPIGKRI